MTMQESNLPRPIYAVVGDSRFLRSRALAEILAVLSDEADALGPARFDGTKAVLAEVLDELRTPSLLGNRRIVIVDDADPFITASRSALERYCASPAPDGSLLLLCNSMPKNTRLYKAIVREGVVIPVAAPKGRAVVRWITDHARAAHGKPLAPGAAQRLFEHLGDAVGLIDAELAKLSAFIGTRESITPEDIDTLTGNLREEKVFAVTDAMAVRDTAGALRQWEQVLATDRAAPARAIAGLAWAVRRLLETRRAWEDGTNIQTLARKTYTDPGVLKQRLERVSIRELEDQLRDLLAADVAIKTGASSIGPAVEKFIVLHTAVQPSTAARKMGKAI